MKVAICGDGGWGTALSILLKNKGLDVHVWGAFQDNIDEINKEGVNRKFLPGVKIPKGIAFTHDPDKACKGADLIVIATPSRFLREALEKHKSLLKNANAPFLSVVKGLEQGSLKRMSEVICEVLGDVRLAVLSGPSIAPEVAREIPTAVVAASKDQKLAQEIRDIFRTERFRVYSNEDVVGVELGGALKNIIAIAVGISDGLGLGANTKAALMTRGLREMAMLGVSMGASIETFQGLSGLGDLVTTCISLEGRNRGFGEKIGNGKKPKDILKKSVAEIEGAWSVKAALELGKMYLVELPITQQVYSVVFENKSAITAVNELMLREPKAE